ncbi:K(+)-transporting ATPase subunit C [Actinokineospora iranica]|uniref:Potassium-transporting ATPase KdpC subunit n=1 Tax=Actinokineospora iranica TaxID=1271860 RepID=A0A1G6N9R0_9PSEU|nr:K(+)-transporting ATPase subunit C [Actinokineospora iranica]SDC64533.1 K+-transporting ATPase ATPase C chain [Actinokineospora iranica]
MKRLLTQTAAGLRALLVLTVLTGIVYPLAVWTVSRAPGLRDNAEGSIVTVDGFPVGSELIGVDPVAADPANDPWFHTRPSAGSADPLGPGDPSNSGGSNKGASNDDLNGRVRRRVELVSLRENVDPAQVPVDAVTASGSGLDPHISPAYAEIQVPRVARASGLTEDRVRRLVAEHTDGRALGFLGEPTVTVLSLNLAVQAAR